VHAGEVAHRVGCKFDGHCSAVSATRG
jgi:hypothetical protein